jgi:hypothetical protein
MLSEIRNITDRNAQGVIATAGQTKGLLEQAAQITALMDRLETSEASTSDAGIENDGVQSTLNKSEKNGDGAVE